MLKQIRGSMKNLASWLIGLPLIIAFAAWGVPEMSQFTRSYAVKVGKTGISGVEVQNEFDRYATNRRLANDGQFDREAAIASGVPNQIVQSLAARVALDHESLKMGLSMPREMVREFLHTSDQFKNPRTGKFDNEALTGILQEYKYSIREFEDRLQSDLLRNQLMSAIGAGGKPPKSLVDSLVLRETENRTISYLTVTDDMAGAATPPTPETLQDYYKKNSTQFMAPEYRVFSTVVLKNSDYVETSSVPEAELRKLYEAGKAKYETAERRTVYQITFPDEKTAKDAVDALKGGKPFETLASENGKTLAEVTLTDIEKRDILDPKVGDAAFGAAEAGAVVGPVKGVFGYSIAQVVLISPASVKPFEEVRGEIEAETQTKDTKKKLFDAIEAIENERDTGASLADAAAKAGMTAVAYGPVDGYSFGSGGEIVAGIPGDVLREAFRIEEGEESDAVEMTDKSGYFFVAVTEVKAPAVIPYDQVANEVLSRWTKEDRETRITGVVKAIRAEVEKGKSLKEAAEPYNRAPIVENLTRRSAGQTLAPAVLEQAFTAAKGEAISGPSAIGDAQVIVTIDAIAFNSSQVSPDEVAMFAQYVGNQLGQELIDAYSNSVTTDAGVKISQEQIDALFSDGQ
ncbi:MAG: hypothetical protein A3E78_07270 [Alphaproteobacteria bacterium RIFCSPHIGHO2_12_FULL_63_12]|nr:MAG: hypothetical protein A3E78_07270 [Alphaproteobacteria bacterium RIFCSPHIGHO2_12_FULL_63_12]